MAEHAAAPQVPDDDEAPAVANEDLAGVPRVFLQSLHHLKHPPLAGLLWQPEWGEHGEPMPMCAQGPPAALPAVAGSARAPAWKDHWSTLPRGEKPPAEQDSGTYKPPRT